MAHLTLIHSKYFNAVPLYAESHIVEFTDDIHGMYIIIVSHVIIISMSIYVTLVAIQSLS